MAKSQYGGLPKGQHCNPTDNITFAVTSEGSPKLLRDGHPMGSVPTHS